MKKSILVLALIGLFQMGNAQIVEGNLRLNGRQKTELKLTSASAVQLFKEFKTKKHQLQFSFDGRDLPTNRYKEQIVFFNFKTQVYRDGELIAKIERAKPMPYFPGEMLLAPESFDFIGILAGMEGNRLKYRKDYGNMPAGKYKIVLLIEPIDIKGRIAPLEINFVLRKRPTR